MISDASQRWWNPEVFARRKGNLELRQRVIRAMRGAFEAQGFAEVETPILQVSPGNEPHLHPFSTQLKSPRPDEPPRELYLHTSPEFAMKKLLVAGVPKLFQLAHVFRNGERSSRHHPEFLMLEWYRAGADTSVIMQDCETLVRAAAKASGIERFTVGANGKACACDPFGPWERLGVAEAFSRYAGIDLLATAPDPQAPDAGLLSGLVRRSGVARVAEGDSWEDLFFRVLGEVIEPVLGRERPTFLCDYPISQAALARPNPSDPRLAERFELYIGGLELANAFGELTDADEQSRRFRADMELKERLYGEKVPVDEDFLAALRHGLPQSSGIALGVDRLVMLCAGATNIEEVLWCPVEVNQGG